MPVEMHAYFHILNFMHFLFSNQWQSSSLFFNAPFFPYRFDYLSIHHSSNNLKLSLHLQSLRSQAELALSGLNESHILSEQKNSECLMKELSSLRVLVFTICDNRKRSADFRDPRTPTRLCLASLWMRRFCSFGRVDSDAMS